MVLTAPLCAGVYLYFQHRTNQEIAKRRLDQQGVLTKVFERSARFGDLVNSKKELQSLGQTFGLKEIKVCQNGVDIIGLATPVSCEKSMPVYPINLAGQNVELQYSWSDDSSFDPVIIRTILFTCVASLIVFMLITFFVYSFLTDKIRKLSSAIGSAEYSSDIRKIDYEIQEFAPIVSALGDLKENLEESSKQIASLRSAEEISKLARQVAHDIRSPLSALKIATAKLSAPVEVGRLLNEALMRIEGIAHDLLKREKKEARGLTDISPNFFYNSIDIKRQEYPGRANFKLNTLLVNPVSIEISDTNLFRLLSNLINNAVESSDVQPAEVVVMAELAERTLRISVTDHGKGMSPDLISRIGREQISSKENGHGLGMLSVFEQVEAVGGSVQIASKVGEGTTIVLLIPTV